MRILITGASGLIGSSFGRYAASSNVVMGAGRAKEPSQPWTGLYTQLKAMTDLSNVIRDFLPDVVLHAAGTASVASSLADPLKDFRGSVQTCAEVLEAARQSGRQPLIIIPSSAAVYGDPPSLPVDEEAALQPISPYGFHKAAIELLAREYAECFDLNIIVCRFFSVFGPLQRRLLVWELYQQLAGPEKIAWLEGTGKETRDFLYVDDLTAALFGLIENFQHSNHKCLIVNVASGVETNVLTLAEMIRDTVAPEKDIRCKGDLRKSDPQRWCADISRLQKLLPSWQARPLPKGLALCAANWQETTDRFSLQHGS
jgi:UDP-glucose 4-epimerase